MLKTFRKMAARCGNFVPLLNLASCVRFPRLPGTNLARTLCSPPSPSSAPGETARAEMPDGEGRAHMLNVVWRIRSAQRRPYWEKRIIKQLLLERKDFPVVHKNTESVNALLRKVRHLVRIKPLSLKQGLPRGDYDSTLLKWNGEFVVRRKLDSLGQETASEAEGSKEGTEVEAGKTGDQMTR